VSSEPCYRCGCPVVVTNDDYGPLCETCESGLWRGRLWRKDLEVLPIDIVATAVATSVIERTPPGQRPRLQGLSLGDGEEHARDDCCATLCTLRRIRG
jgi:hypothetical protein